jgi:hypothetical protein
MMYKHIISTVVVVVVAAFVTGVPVNQPGK